MRRPDVGKVDPGPEIVRKNVWHLQGPRAASRVIHVNARQPRVSHVENYQLFDFVSCRPRSLHAEHRAKLCVQFCMGGIKISSAFRGADKISSDLRVADDSAHVELVVTLQQISRMEINHSKTLEY